MRYYELILTLQDAPSPADEKHGLCTGVPSKATGKTGTVKKWSSLNKDGSHNPNALQIDFDIPINGFDTPMNANSIIKLMGITAEDRSDSITWAGAKVELYVGMSKGMPLVDPDQNGLALSGQVYQAYGNWQGEQQSIDIVVMPSASASNNYTVDWKAGTPIEAMITQVLNRTHPNVTVKNMLTKSLVLSRHDAGVYYNLASFATYVKAVSRSINTDPNYSGVSIFKKRDVIVISDFTADSAAKKIRFIDIIGQPTWISVGAIQFKAVMRADLHMDDIINLPKSALKTTTKSMQGFKKDDVNFKGNFRIYSVRHVGSNRQATADSWVTVFEALVI